MANGSFLKLFLFTFSLVPMFFSIRDKKREGLVDLQLHISAHLPTQLATLMAWASGQKYATTPQTVYDYIIRSTKPS